MTRNEDESRNKAFTSAEAATVGNRPYVVMTYTPYVDFEASMLTLTEWTTYDMKRYMSSSSPKLVWSSSDSSVVSVDPNGIVTAVKYGTATVTATFTDIDGKVYSNSVDVYVYVKDNPYYSLYEPEKFNFPGDIKIGTTTDHIQFRMNCYGYAFGHIYERSVIYTSNGGYKQQPGDFAYFSDKRSVRSIRQPSDVKSMDKITTNMQLDAERLGYSLTEYSTTSDAVAQFGVNSRLIAVVTGGNDFHFYMQHSDGTWSHKPGSTPVSNASIDSNILLNNSNIKELANEGRYAGGDLKFFIITKSTVVDHPHSKTCCDMWPLCDHTYNTSLYYRDEAGDYMETAATVESGIDYSCYIDFADDQDFFSFRAAPSGGNYVISVTTSKATADLNYVVYNEFGSKIEPYKSTGEEVYVSLGRYQKCYIYVYNNNKTMTPYTLTIKKEG